MFLSFANTPNAFFANDVPMPPAIAENDMIYILREKKKLNVIGNYWECALWCSSAQAAGLHNRTVLVV